jgi:hypothetical protein
LPGGFHYTDEYGDAAASGRESIIAMTLGEMFDLDELAADCRIDGRLDCLLAALLLHGERVQR